MKLSNKLLIPVALCASLLGGLVACSGSESDDATSSTVMTVDDFSTGKFSIPIHGATVFTLEPTGRYNSNVGPNGKVTVEGNILIGDSTISALFDYYTIDSDGVPTLGVLDVSLRYPSEDATNSDLLNGAGVPSAEMFTAMSITFNFDQGTCDLSVSGFQTQTSTAGSAQVEVTRAYPGIVYRLIGS